jgi:integrase
MLTAKKIEKLRAPGRYRDGAIPGLYLQIRSADNKSWLLRYERAGREHWHGLGPVHTVDLKTARLRARSAKLLLLDNIDPIAHRQEQRAAQAAASIKRTTFGECIESYLRFKSPEWKNAKHGKQWAMSLRVYAKPLHTLSPADIDLAVVAKTLEPIWTKIPETASRTRSRIEACLDHWAAKNEVHGYSNPASWERLKHVLPSPAKLKGDNHHAAIPYRDVPVFAQRLREREDLPAKALLLLTLCALRSQEVREAAWAEIDFDAAVWTIPAHRMKAGREHVVPLAPEVLDLLRSLPREDGDGAFVFPGPQPGRPMNDLSLVRVMKRMGYAAVPHGLRSSFSDWAHEQTAHSNHSIEISLAHKVGSAQERDYRRGPMLAKRRRLMADWARYCFTPAAAQPGKVIGIGGRR